MDRPIVYTGAIPLDTDLLFLAAAAMEGQAWQAQGLLGTGPYLTDLTCTQTVVASLAVLVNPGQIFSLQNFDASAYSDLGTNSNNILKQGILRSAATIGCAAPVTVGFSINYLIEVGFLTVDGGSTVLPYYNASNPLVAWAGPANTGTSQNTRRNDTLVVQAKAGTAATTGTQTTPSADSGFVGAFVVTVAQGQTTITSSNIVQLASAPFFTKLPAIPAAIQAETFTYFADTGSANALVITPAPAITAYAQGQSFAVKVANTVTGATTINVNGLGTKSIKRADLTALAGGDLVAGQIVTLTYDGTQFQVVGLTTNNLPLSGSQYFASTGTFTVPANIYRIKYRLWSSGGGGGGAAVIGAGGGGNGGAYVEGYSAVTPGQTIAVTVGAGGANGAVGNNAGGTGGTVSLGALASATGGGGGSGGGGGAGGSTGGSSTPTGGLMSFGGYTAQAGNVQGSTFVLGGQGGNSALGGGGAIQPICTTSAITGSAGGIPGGGGGGAGAISVGSTSGGTGGKGCVYIEY